MVREGQRNFIGLQDDLANVLTAKDVVGYANYPVKGVTYTIERENTLKRPKGIFDRRTNGSAIMSELKPPKIFTVKSGSEARTSDLHDEGTSVCFCYMQY